MIQNDLGRIGGEGEGAGKGVRAHRAGKRRYWLLTLAQIFIAFAIVGVVLLTRQGVGPGAIPPPIAIAAAAGLALVLNVGGWMTFRIVDEMESRINLVAFTIGFFAHLTLYLVWSLLWSGGIAGPPDATVLVMASGLAALAAYCWLKFGPARG